MTKEDNKKERKSWWMQFLISVVGTAIGVGLTFAVSNKIENQKKEQAQRMTAMMVIHDIDVSIERVQSLKDDMEKQYNAVIYAMSHLDQIDDLPQDTLILALTYIVSDEKGYSFDMSKEKIFNSSPDTWQNLGSMKFIDNVQSFYFNRQSFIDTYDNSIYWQRPVMTRELEQINILDESLSLEQYQKLYFARLRQFLKEKLTETNVQNYIAYSGFRLQGISDMIGGWIRVNNENKFLMSITDEELENYVNSINQTGVAIKDENLIGTWKVSSSDDITEEWEFKEDHTYTVLGNQSRNVNMPFARGKIKISFTTEGTWAIEGDSLIQVMDWDKYNPVIDGSGMKALPGRQEMLDNFMNEYEKSLTDYISNNAGRKDRNAYGACMDASGDKIELKKMKTEEKGKMDVEIQYLKRKK